MNTSGTFNGVYSLLLTPFQSDKKIDWDTYEKYVEWQLAFQPNGLFAVCGTSEMKWLLRSERMELAKRAVKRAGNLPVIATANLDDDRQMHKEEIQEMIETGVSGIVLVPPLGLGIDASQLEEYFSELIELSSVPVLIYEWPQTAPHIVSAETFSSLVKRTGLRGIKDTTCTLEGISEKIKSISGYDATVFQANIPFLLDSLDVGVEGIMAVVSSCCADWVVELWQRRHDLSARGDLYSKLLQLDMLLRLGYPATGKFLARARGIDISPATRWPIELTKEAERALAAFVDEFALQS
ncbi:dihydrodipicolinate synthase family protein [Alicyclobacillus sp. SO9]|uniref:dihydrodipicolinate synthase family protein n=1 Tax=Alicyclobacillus sp. SO9 TaxID=2665646 RepID=UPI0018E7229D|nr:dihydrodipicolinate synthase family protein [Alicyclobacillus sp. SO9]QQE80565.1 dihydrodipicolinate synthase family protein [Alicyclobacillus sp. SO9]